VTLNDRRARFPGKSEREVSLVRGEEEGGTRMLEIKKYLNAKREEVDRALEECFPRRAIENEVEGLVASLDDAIRYSVFAGGKRLRPILAIAAFEAMGGAGDQILPFACGLEMIHTYSLIHDDLPAIDDDDYRRGRPSCHKAFGEALAILAGDGLLTEAFHLMAKRTKSDTRMDDGWLVLDVVREVAEAAGIAGMVAGQVVDIKSEGKEIDLPAVEYLHTHKTGKMIRVSVRLGARLGGATGDRLDALTAYGEKVGLAFQIQDDILNVEGKSELLGKKTGSDAAKRKGTYPSVIGIEASKKRAADLVDSALRSLGTFGSEADPLREIARFIVSRET
jgi:geranylgeranyl diphosphate synthase type II